MNQTLEIALRAYVNESLNNWADHLVGFTLSYNTTKHTSTGFTPAFLLRGYNPRTPNLMLQRGDNEESIQRRPQDITANLLLDPDSPEFTEDFTYFRSVAKDALKLAQTYQEKYYNETHTPKEFEEGDLVLINLHSLQLLQGFVGRGRKLLPRFEGPFEIIGKVSPVAYRLRLPASFQGHLVINIAHLEPYHTLIESRTDRPKLSNTRRSFDELEEFEVERIIESKIVKGPRGCQVRKYQVRWKGYEPKYDTWETKRNLKNVPEALRDF